MAEGNIVSVESVSNGKLIEEYVTKALDLIILKGVKDLGEELGTGTFGYVRKVEWQGLPCAAKVFNQDRMEECTTARYEKKSFDREVYLWALCLRHKNIVQMYGLWEHASGTGIVMELLATNLASFLKKSRTRIHSITLDVKRGILLDICCGMRYLHGMNVMHRSLSSSNVLLTSNFVAKISDFSTARVYENFDEGKASNFSKYLRLKKSFVAPEMFSQNHGLKSDIFSFGCIIIHSLTHEDPKPCVGSTEFDKRAYLLNNIVDDVVIEFKPLIQRCLAAPELRPSFLDLYVQISRHPHVEDEDRMNLTFSQIDELHSCHIPKTRRVSYVNFVFMYIQMLCTFVFIHIYVSMTMCG